ncbi:MAG: hypothetical protein RLO80_01530 [Hyphomonas sp.]
MRIEAYAVVSEDDRITGASGEMPAELKTAAEWNFFQAGLDEADIVVLGRFSHLVAPNPKKRRRLVMTRSVPRLQREGEITVFWNPGGSSLAEALAAFAIPVAHLAIAGGQGVFDHFLSGPHTYTAFHLSRIDGVTLPGGRAVFGEVEASGSAATALLQAHGYHPGPRRQLDPLAHVITWTPAPG